MNDNVVYYLKKLENISLNRNEVYKARAFSKAVQTIKTLKTPLLTAEQIKNLSGIGKGIIQRITEILSTGKLKEVDEANIDEKQEVIDKFLKIHGVGQKTADKWYKEGYRNVQDLSKNKNLTSAQKIGIKYTSPTL
jgi:DNA polymerase/3'-5' exonuclease PolX